MPVVSLPLQATYIVGSPYAANNYGAAGDIAASTANTSLLKADVSSIPAGAVVTSAAMYLTMEKSFSTQANTLSVHRLLKDWGEGTKNGTAAGTGECNWTYAKSTSSAWGTAGAKGAADRVSTASFSLGILNNALGVKEFPQLEADVQAWVDGTAPNYGWGLYGSASEIAVFASDDNATPSYRPYLLVEYSLPGNACPVTTDPPVVTVTPRGGSERALRLDGAPTFSVARGVGYEQASIPVAYEDLQAPDLQGADLHIHGTGWRGVIVKRPVPGSPLEVVGKGLWAGSLIKRAVLYLDNRLTSWKPWVPDSGEGITPAVLGLRWYLGITKGVEVGAYANSGIQFYDERGFTGLRFRWSKSKSNTSYGLVVYSGTAEGVIAATEYTSTGSGDVNNWIDIALPLDTVWAAIALYNSSAAFTPTAGGEGISVWGIEVTGRDLATIDTETVAIDILNAEIGDPYGLTPIAVDPFIQHTPATISPLVFDASTPAEKFAILMERAPIEYGWYEGRHWDSSFPTDAYPHIFDRPTAPAYLLPLHSCEEPPQIELSSLDEMTSGTYVAYERPDGFASTYLAVDADETHPLVALGIQRYGEVSTQAADDTEAAYIGMAANAERGRQRVRGSVTVRELLTITGAVADRYAIRPGEVVRLTGTEAGAIDVRILRVTWRGGLMTLEFDSGDYRLDAMLANLAAKR